MANLNPTAYANGGITIPNGLVGMPNNPRGITPMHLAMAPPSINPIGFPTMLPSNMNSQSRNQVPYLRQPTGKSILRVFLFGEYLTGENQNKKDIGYWRRIVSEFFSEEGRMIYGLCDENGGSRNFDIPNPVISRFFQVNYESGVTSIQLTMNNIKENFSIANYIYNSTVEAKASLIYNYEDGSRVVASGRLKVRLNQFLKIDCFEFNTEKYMEYVPRQQTMISESPIGSLGIPMKTLRCLELAEGVVTLHDVIEKSISSNKGPSPPEPPAKTPKEKAENTNPEQQYNNTDVAVPSPSTSNANIKDSPSFKSAVKSPALNTDTPKQQPKRRTKPTTPRKNSRQETVLSLYHQIYIYLLYNIFFKKKKKKKNYSFSQYLNLKSTLVLIQRNI
ncbi:LIM-domain binding protein [Glomus cerebriforme]|uniref:LIM-domain binding protein n=1 Tax=Glomus cerebriforme TaxID=658196 RepID=A0A397TCD3_9GLOM|nr:LIM-domain binding protein [Glomus cerebriforme]